MAVQSALAARQKIAGEISSGLAKKVKTSNGQHDDSELRDTLNKLVSPQTHFEHSIVHTRISSDGEHTAPEVNDQHTYAQKHLNRFKNLRVSAGDGITSYVKGTLNEPGNKKHNKEMNVAQISTKGSSGPMQNTVGSLKLVNKEHGDE